MMFIREMGDPAERERAFIQLQTMLKYGELTTCRKKFLLEYFGESWPGGSCGACDVCIPTVSAPLAAGSAGKKSVDYDQELFDQLRVLRRALAEERAVPPYVVFSDKTLQDMSRFYPQSQASMAKIFEVKTMRGSFVIAKIAGTESTAKMMSVNSKNMRAKNKGVTWTSPSTLWKNFCPSIFG
jgi:superfamily II DNA helicase RecQ